MAATVSEIQKEVFHLLQKSQILSARLDADLIVGFVLGKSREQLLISNTEEITEKDRQEIFKMTAKRADGWPLAYLTGKKSFFDIDFDVRSGVLIPRPETEHLVEESLQWMASQNQESFTIVDLGCGSGCIGLSILNNTINSKLIAVDKSEIACAVTGENGRKLGLSERINILNLSAEELAHTNTDLVVANPPYVSPSDMDLDPNVRQYEPAEALFSNDSGYEHIASWKNVASRVLRPGGLLLMEIGFRQGPRTLGIFQSDPAFVYARIGKDLSGNDRYLVATRATGG